MLARVAVIYMMKPAPVTVLAIVAAIFMIEQTILAIVAVIFMMEQTAA